MKKPAGLFGREREWDALKQFATDRRPGARLAVVRGRRRHGKSVLLRAVSSAADGFYYQALEGTSADQLRDFGRSFGAYLGLPTPPDFHDWSHVLEVMSQSRSTGLSLVVLDEFSYLVDADPGLPSLLQRWLDERSHEGLPLGIVVCGSALSIMSSMSSLLVGAAPLRGRASLELPVRAFDYRSAARFQGLSGAVTAAKTYAILGGVPGYFRDLLAGDVPRDDRDFDEWVVDGPLSATRPLLYEARHLLDDPGIRGRAVYLSVLSAVAAGARTNGDVAHILRRDTAAVAQPLSVLADLELVRRDEDPLRARRPLWTVADPLLRFWSMVMRPDWARLEEGRAAEVWRDAAPRWQSQVLGPAIEEIGRAWVRSYAPMATDLRQVGAAVINDPAGRTQVEVDIIGIDATSGRVRVIGEVKSGTAGAGELGRLQSIKKLLMQRDLADPGTSLVLVALNGFSERVVDTDLTLVDAARLYS